MGKGKKQLASRQVGKPPEVQKAPQNYKIIAGVLVCYAWTLTWFHGFLFATFTNNLQGYIASVGDYLVLLGNLSTNVIEVAFPPAVLGMGIFLAAYFLGRLLLDLLDVHSSDDFGRGFWALGLGLGSLSLSLLFLGLAGLWRTPIMVALVGVPLVGGFAHYWRSIRARFTTARDWLFLPSIWEVLALAVMTLYLLMGLLSALGPEIFYDSLVYHLALPKLYLLAGRIVPTPTMIYSGIPFGTEMLYGLGLAFRDESLAKLLHFGFGLATTVATYSWCRKRVDRRGALLAAMLFSSAHMVVWQSGVSQVELAWTFYNSIAAFALLEALELAPGAMQNKLIALSGALAGFAAGTKYNAGLYVAAFAVPLVFQHFRSAERSARRLFAQGALFFGVAALVVSPWFIKNWLFYHNPTYPFLGRWFGGQSLADVAALKADAKARDIVAALTTWAGFRDLLAGLWDPHWQIADWLGIAMPFALPWVFLVPRQYSRQSNVLGVLIGIWLAWALHTRMPRFFMPAVPFFAIMAASAVSLAEIPRLARTAVAWAFLGVIGLNLGGAFFAWSKVDVWKVPLGWTSREDYLLHAHPGYGAMYYPGVRYLNTKAPEDATVLFVGEARGYYCERRFITASVFDPDPMMTFAESSGSVDELVSKLKGLGVTYLLLNRGSPQFNESLSRLSPAGRERFWKMLQERTQLLLDDKNLDPRSGYWVDVAVLRP